MGWIFITFAHLTSANVQFGNYVTKEYIYAVIVILLEPAFYIAIFLSFWLLCWR